MFKLILLIIVMFALYNLKIIIKSKINNILKKENNNENKVEMQQYNKYIKIINTFLIILFILFILNILLYFWQ